MNNRTDSRRTADGTVKKKNKKNKKEDKDIYGEFQNVKLLKAEHQKLVKGYGKQITGEMTERLSAYVASSGKRYSSHYATILGWLRNDGVDPLRECKATDPMPDQVQNKNKWTHPDLVQVRNSVTGKTGKKCRHCEIVFER
ncbi:hypothetical protein KAR91_11825 [Candidatus Pacearchaeota archaeon]|nr:hypothetical protein [Candidatus Pacearchaeota archaeon]